MPHAPNHQQRQDRRVSGGPNQAGSITLNSDPYGIKNKAVSAIAAPVGKAIGSAIPAALGGGGAGLAALTPLMGPLALAGIAGKVFGFFNEGTTDVKDQAQELAQSVTDQNKRTMRAPMQYNSGTPSAKGMTSYFDYVKNRYLSEDEMNSAMARPPVLSVTPAPADYKTPPGAPSTRIDYLKFAKMFGGNYSKGDPDIDADAEDYYRMFGDDRYKELDGILRFPREFDPTDNLGPYDPFDDVRRMMAVPPMMMASNTITPAYGSIPVPTYEGDPAQLELFSIPGLPTQSYEEKMYYQDADMGKLNKGTASVEPKQLEMFAIPGRQGQSYEEKIYYQDADSGKLNRGTRRVSLPADPMMSMQKQHNYLPNVKGNSLKNIIAHEEFKKNPPYIPMAPLSSQDFTGYARGASGVRSAQGLDNASGGTFVPDFIKPLIEGGSYTPGMPADSIRYQHLHNTGTLPAIQPMPTPGPYIGPLSDRQMKNQLHQQKMMHNEQRHKKQMMTT